MLIQAWLQCIFQAEMTAWLYSNICNVASVDLWTCGENIILYYDILLGFFFQGMAYLANMRVIHCDLAGRNVLLTDKLVAKITDFGLAKILQKDKDYYTRSTGKELPLMWSVYNMNYVNIHSITCLRCTCTKDINVKIFVTIHRRKSWEMKNAFKHFL